MALAVDTLKEHCNVSGTDDDAVLTRLLAAATRHVERVLGYAINDEDKFPDGTPEDVEQAVYLLSAHWYENREASLVAVSAAPLPMGVSEILNEYRNFTFGVADA